MAPSSVVARSDGLSVTSVSVKNGHIKYGWNYKDQSPKYFTVLVIHSPSHEYYVLDEYVKVRGHGSKGSGKDTVSIEVLKGYPGKYVLALVDVDNWDHVYAKSEEFHVRASDF